MTSTAESADDAEVARFLSAWFAVRQFIQSANFNHFHQAGLSATQFMILNLLPADRESISIGDLARRMNLKPATIAKTVDSLEARQLLKRARSKEDGRLVLVRITRPGQKLQNAAVGQFRRHIDHAFRGMRSRDRAALIYGLESFVAALNAQSGSSGAARTMDVVERQVKRSTPQSRQL